MHRQLLPLAPGVLDDGGVADVGDLLGHVQLAQVVEALMFILDGLELFTIFEVDILDVAQPVVDETQLLILHRGLDAAAAIVTADDDVLHLEHFYRVLQHGEAVEIGMYHQIGDVAVDEDVPRQQPHQLVGGDPAVGTTDPEVFGGLLGRKSGKEIGIFGFDPFGPLTVVGKQVVQQFHFCSP